MRAILRKTSLYSLGLYILTNIFPGGVVVTGGLQTFLVGGITLALLFFLLRPILIFLTLPLQFATLGLASILVNAIILFALTHFISQIIIKDFVFPGFTSYGLLIPKVAIPTILAYILSAVTLSFFVTIVGWIFKG